MAKKKTKKIVKLVETVEMSKTEVKKEPKKPAVFVDRVLARKQLAVPKC